ncbi:hypothetical protein GCM10027030_09960 [Luteococcus sediminum]
MIEVLDELLYFGLVIVVIRDEALATGVATESHETPSSRACPVADPAPRLGVNPSREAGTRRAHS